MNKEISLEEMKAALEEMGRKAVAASRVLAVMKTEDKRKLLNAMADSILADYSAPAVAGESPSWAPDGRHVVYCNGGTLYIVDTWLGKTRRLVGGRSKVFQPDWSPVLH